MKTPALLVMVVVMVLPLSVMGVTPVHMGRISVDSSEYERVFTDFVPGPYISGAIEITHAYPKSGEMFLQAFKRKNSNQFDLYSFTGKIGTSVIPLYNLSVSTISFSRTMVDDDAGWESIVNYAESMTDITLSIKHNIFFKVFDDDGTELLADSGRAYYGFDGNNTYVVTCNNIYRNYIYDSWRFRTNISSESPKSLAKTKSIQSSPMQIYGLSGGDYRVTLSPSSGNQINFQMFDLLGRCVFDKQVQNLTSPVTFTVPEGNVPNTPFIAKVNDGNGSVVKKQIPVK